MTTASIIAISWLWVFGGWLSAAATSEQSEVRPLVLATIAIAWPVLIPAFVLVVIGGRIWRTAR